MNYYLVYGERSVDMCGNTAHDELGIIPLNRDEEFFIEPRPTPDSLGFFKYNGEYYLTIKYVKTTDFHPSFLTFKETKRST